MAANWINRGFSVSVWNRTRAKAEPLAAMGAAIAASPGAATENADIVWAMVADDDASRDVWLGGEGALAGIRPGAIAIESSTLSPAWVRELAGLAAASGVDFLDAPVGGSKAVAAEGKLAVFVGGEAAVLERARPAFEAIGGRIHHLGPHGAGATWKLINYMMAGAQIAGAAEGLTLAAKAGIDVAKAAELIAGGVTASPAVTGKLQRMIEKRLGDPDVALRLVAKDQRYALALARSLGVTLEMIAASAEIYRRAEAEGLGDLDLAAVIEAVAPKSSG
jgi:3-hydroxyisobutyrate dehydrogenase-like beta-hydroxyacid dehydrogenase